MVLDLTPQRGAPWGSYADFMGDALLALDEPVLPPAPEDIAAARERLIDWWLPYRLMDNWVEDGIPPGAGGPWPGPSGVSYAARRRWHIGRLFGWQCWYCRCKLTPQNFTADHLTPTSRGGVDSVENVRPCCVSCNSRKGAHTEAEYRVLVAA